MTDDRPFDAATLAFYAREALVYTASGPNGASRHLAAFLDLLPPGARILDLGCGGGRDAAAMLERGFDVDATDGTSEVAVRAEARIGRPVRVMRFDELSAEEEYDAVWAHASLLHVPRLALPGVLGRVRLALKPCGPHFASFKSGGNEGRDGFGRYFNYPSLPQLLQSYARSGSWEALAVDEYMGGGYDRRQGPWIAATMKRAE